MLGEAAEKDPAQPRRRGAETGEQTSFDVEELVERLAKLTHRVAQLEAAEVDIGSVAGLLVTCSPFPLSPFLPSLASLTLSFFPPVALVLRSLFLLPTPSLSTSAPSAASLPPSRLPALPPLALSPSSLDTRFPPSSRSPSTLFPSDLHVRESARQRPLKARTWARGLTRSVITLV